MKLVSIERKCSHLNYEGRLLICKSGKGYIHLRGENASLCVGMEMYKDELKTNLENIKNCSYRIK